MGERERKERGNKNQRGLRSKEGNRKKYEVDMKNNDNKGRKMRK